MALNLEAIKLKKANVATVRALLSNFDIEVTQRGSKPYTVRDFSGKVIQINIPHLPDEADMELINAIRGFVDIEVSRTLFNFDEREIEEEKLASVFSALEASRTEKKMCEMYRGSHRNFTSVHRFYFDKKLKQQFDKLKEVNSEEVYSALLLTPLVRALSMGNDGSQVFAELVFEYKDKIPTILKKIQPLSLELQSIKTSDDSYIMAQKIIDALKEISPPTENCGQENQEQDEENQEQDEENQDQDENDEESQSQDQESQDENGEENQDEERQDTESNNANENQDEDKEDDSEIKNGKIKQDEKSDEDDEKQDIQSQFDLNSFFEELEDQPDEKDFLEDEIFQKVKNLNKNSEYRVYTTDFDLIQVLEVPKHKYSNDLLVSMEDQINHIIAPMQKNLERIIVAKDQTRWNIGLRKGAINSSSLARLTTKDERVFRKKQTKTDTKNVAVSIVVDASGSMSFGGGNTRISLASMSALALSQTLDRFNIKNEVICFTTRPSHVTRADEHFPKSSSNWSRVEPLYMPILKGFNERLNPNNKKRFAYLPKSGIFANNIDGECVLNAYLRLSQNTEKRKIMMVLSDGQPAGHGNSRDQDENLKNVVRSIEKSGTSVVGIGIQSDCVADYYKNNVVIQNINDLPQVVLSNFKHLLFQNN